VTTHYGCLTLKWAHPTREAIIKYVIEFMSRRRKQPDLPRSSTKAKRTRVALKPRTKFRVAGEIDLMLLL